MNIASTRNYTPIRMKREKAQRILQGRTQNVTLGDQEFGTRTQALQAIGDSVELPCRGLRLTQSATRPHSPEERLAFAKRDIRAGKTPELLLAGMAAVSAGMAYMGEAPLWVPLTMAGISAAVSGFAALDMRHKMAQAEENMGPDDYTVVESRVEEHILPSSGGQPYEILPSGGGQVNYYQVSPDPEDRASLIFQPVSKGHHEALSGSSSTPFIYDHQERPGRGSWGL